MSCGRVGKRTEKKKKHNKKQSYVLIAICRNQPTTSCAEWGDHSKTPSKIVLATPTTRHRRCVQTLCVLPGARCPVTVLLCGQDSLLASIGGKPVRELCVPARRRERSNSLRNPTGCLIVAGNDRGDHCYYHHRRYYHNRFKRVPTRVPLAVVAIAEVIVIVSRRWSSFRSAIPCRKMANLKRDVKTNNCKKIASTGLSLQGSHVRTHFIRLS